MRNAKGLIVRKPWIDLILDGTKTWEMRSKHTRHRGPTYLIEAGSGLIVGKCLLVGTHELSAEPSMFEHEFHHHQVNDRSLLEKWNIAWRLTSAQRLEKPIPYKHPKGAVTWVNLPEPFYD